MLTNSFRETYDEFQFTPLREGRPPYFAENAKTRPLFQFTPLREGRPVHGGEKADEKRVSIHAPA